MRGTICVRSTVMGRQARVGERLPQFIQGRTAKCPMVDFDLVVVHTHSSTFAHRIIATARKKSIRYSLRSLDIRFVHGKSGPRCSTILPCSDCLLPARHCYPSLSAPRVLRSRV